MTTIETKAARLNDLKAELAEIRAEMKDDSISNARWGRLQNYRYEIRCEIEKLQAEIDAEIDANIEKVAAQKVDAILTSGVQPVIVNTTFKNNRCSVNIDGAKVSLDKAVTILCESELARRGENVLLINENSDVCPLDEDLFILGKHNVKTAIRQFARGEKVTGAKVLNGKFYPVVKANAEPAAEPAAEPTVEETANAETEPVEDKPRRFMATIYFETVNGARVCDSVEFPNAQLAAQAAIDYVASHADRKVTTVYINDFVSCSEYITTDADITALYPVEETAIVETANVEEKATFEVGKEIDATNAEDDFDYRAAEEHIENCYHDCDNFIRYNVSENGLTQEQCEIIYAAAHADREFSNPDFDLIDRMVEEYTRANAGDNNDAAPTEPAPVEERKLTRRESLEIDKQVVMSEIDEYREGLIEYQDDPDVNPTHIDFLKSSIDSKLAEYYDICKQLDELDDEPNPAPDTKAPPPESDDERIDAPGVNVETVKYVATQITFPTGHEGEPTREVSKTFDNLDDAAKFIADDNPYIETATGYRTFAYDDGYFGGVYWAGYRIETTDGKILVEADIYEVKGDESIDRLVIKYINDNDNTVPEPPANNPLACLNNLGYEDDVIEPVHETVDETVENKEYAVTIAQLKDAYDSAVSMWGAVDYNARTNKSLRPVVKTALATVTAAETALQAFGDAHIAQLCPLLDQTIRGATIHIINEDGIDWGSQKLADISLKFRLTGPDFAIIANDNYYATCATPDDVRRVIERLKQAIACGAAEFSFAPQNFTPEPPTDELIATPEVKAPADDYPATECRTTSPAFVDTVASVARICTTVNAAATQGWEVYYDTPTKLFVVAHNNETVARLTGVELYDAWDSHLPEDFFDEFYRPEIEFDEHGDIIPWF